MSGMFGKSVARFLNIAGSYLVAVDRIVAYMPYKWISSVEIDANQGTIYYPQEVDNDSFGVGLRLWILDDTGVVRVKDIVATENEKELSEYIAKITNILDELLFSDRPIVFSLDSISKELERIEPFTYMRIGDLRVRIDKIIGFVAEGEVSINDIEFYYASARSINQIPTNDCVFDVFGMVDDKNADIPTSVHFIVVELANMAYYEEVNDLQPCVIYVPFISEGEFNAVFHNISELINRLGGGELLSKMHKIVREEGEVAEEENGQENKSRSNEKEEQDIEKATTSEEKQEVEKEEKNE